MGNICKKGIQYDKMEQVRELTKMEVSEDEERRTAGANDGWDEATAAYRQP